MKFSDNISKELISELSSDVVGFIEIASTRSYNPGAVITSLRREPKKQAQVMYYNLSNNIRILYASAGNQVTLLYDELIKQSKDKDYIIDEMTKKIEDLASKGLLVSKHCVSKEAYKKLAVIDVSGLANPRDFVKEFLFSKYVKRIITPFKHDYNDIRVIVDNNEPCVHLEIEQIW